MLRLVVPRLSLQQLQQHHLITSTCVVVSGSSNSTCSNTVNGTRNIRSLSSSSSSSDNNNNNSSSSLPYNVCFLRHGQSTWNRDNRFIGWTDTPLTEDGVMEAHVAGQLLKQSNIQFDEVHTSLLRRSIRTTNVVLMELQQEYIPVYKHWRLNERHYGNLVGLNKKQLVNQYGKDQVKRWRRSYDEPPPEMTSDHPYHPKHDPRYKNVSGSVSYPINFFFLIGRILRKMLKSNIILFLYLFLSLPS
jgi:Histidine phosphatase superfamily (branch 1)